MSDFKKTVLPEETVVNFFYWNSIFVGIDEDDLKKLAQCYFDEETRIRREFKAEQAYGSVSSSDDIILSCKTSKICNHHWVVQQALAADVLWNMTAPWNRIESQLIFIKNIIVRTNKFINENGQKLQLSKLSPLLTASIHSLILSIASPRRQAE